jgi:hypothetical protein
VPLHSMTSLAGGTEVTVAPRSASASVHRYSSHGFVEDAGLTIETSTPFVSAAVNWAPAESATMPT